MKNLIFLLSIILFFVGCTKQIDIAELSIPKKELAPIYYTYDLNEEQITAYIFKQKEDSMYVSYFVKFIPYDHYGLLSSPLSIYKIRFDAIVNKTAATIKEALESNVKANGYKTLFKYKKEYILSTEFAKDIVRLIDEHDEVVDKMEDEDTKKVYIPRG